MASQVVTVSSSCRFLTHGDWLHGIEVPELGLRPSFPSCTGWRHFSFRSHPRSVFVWSHIDCSCHAISSLMEQSEQEGLGACTGCQCSTLFSVIHRLAQKVASLFVTTVCSSLNMLKSVNLDFILFRHCRYRIRTKLRDRLLCPHIWISFEHQEATRHVHNVGLPRLTRPELQIFHGRVFHWCFGHKDKVSHDGLVVKLLRHFIGHE